MRSVIDITSLTPTIDASVVAIVRIAYQFIHGGSIRLTHCGRMIFHNVSRRENASERAASHCAVGIDWTAPRTISAMFAMIGNARPIVALIQSGNGIVTPPTWNSNGSRYMTKKSSTSHGALRKNWTTTHDVPRTGERSEIRANPRATPATVPIAIAQTLISRLHRKPFASNGVHLASNCSTVALVVVASPCATATDTTNAVSRITPVRAENSAAPLERSPAPP